MYTLKATLVLVLLLLLSPVSQATAILTTETGYLSATVGSAYPTLPGAPVYTETTFSEVLQADFGSGGFDNSDYPNYGWVGWQLAESAITLYAGQDWRECDTCPAQGYGFSELSFFWIFSVEGDGGRLQQDLLSGTGSGTTTLIDLTDPTLFATLSVTGSFGYGNHSFDLLDDHVYLLSANLANQAAGDGREVEYFINLDNAVISVPEPNPFTILVSGLVVLAVLRKPRLLRAEKAGSLHSFDRA